MSSAAQVSNGQWGNHAVWLGSFGQGFVGQARRFANLNDEIFESQARVFIWREEAQIAFDRFVDAAIELLAGTQVSETGFF